MNNKTEKAHPARRDLKTGRKRERERERERERKRERDGEKEREKKRGFPTRITAFLPDIK